MSVSYTHLDVYKRQTYGFGWCGDAPYKDTVWIVLQLASVQSAPSGATPNWYAGFTG